MPERRNIVLSLMRQNGYISEQEYDEAVAAPLSAGQGRHRSPWTRPISSTW